MSKKLHTYDEYLIYQVYPNINFDKLREINEQLNETEEINEGFFSSIIGALGGSWVGPKLGRLIAKVLGVQAGLLYNFLTSPAIGAAMGYEFAKTMTEPKNPVAPVTPKK